MSCRKLDQTVIQEGFLDSFDYVFTDCDGVIWSGDNALPGSVEALDLLRKKGKKIFCVTNNSTRSIETYLEKCNKLKVNVASDEFYGTAYCVSLYLKKIGFNKKVYIIGSSGFVQEFDKFGISYLPIGPDDVSGDWLSVLKNTHLDPDVGAVVVGFDFYFSYVKMIKAASYARKEGSLFIASNADETFPPVPGVDDNVCIAGTGSMLAAIEAAAGKKSIVIGKPEKFMFDCIKDANPQIDPSRSIMIGDRLDSDILFGKNNGLRTLLVLSGINSLEDVENFKKQGRTELVPDYWLKNLGELVNVIN